MYTSFFGFKCKPFQLTPDPEFLFMSRVHKRALTYLNYGIEDNSGFILVTGEIGTGKTTIIRTMLKQIPQEIKLARINNTKVSSKQLISMINEDFGINTKDKDKTQMLSELTGFLIKQYAEGQRVIIIIDEAQNLSPDLLEEIRLLSNLETDKSKLLQIILIGQPELNTTLSRPGLEQLRQRIAINTHISPLSREETDSYIRHRLKVAGNEDGIRFEEGVMEAIYDFSKGIPRLINILCEFTLLAAFTDSRNTIDINLIKEIMNDLINERPETKASVPSSEFTKQDVSRKIKNALSSIHVRLQNLETATHKIQKGTNTGNATRKQGYALLLDAFIEKRANNIDSAIIDEIELNKKEEDLLKREYALLEKEELLRKREEKIRHIFKQNSKESSFKKI